MDLTSKYYGEFYEWLVHSFGPNEEYNRYYNISYIIPYFEGTKDVNKHINCPNCNKRIFIDKDDFLTTFENIKNQFKD